MALQLEVLNRWQSVNTELAIKAFELSHRLEEKRLAADHGVKRQILETICLNVFLNGATLVPGMRRPFDVLAEGLLVKEDRGV